MKSTHKTLTFLLAAAIAVSAISVTQASSVFFADISGHWAETQIISWTDREVINGYGADFFPENPITRAEISAIFSRLMKQLPSSKAENTFTDLPKNEWYTENILTCVKAGLLKGDDNTVIRPEEHITREEAAIIFLNQKRFQIFTPGEDTRIFDFIIETLELHAETATAINSGNLCEICAANCTDAGSEDRETYQCGCFKRRGQN